MMPFREFLEEVRPTVNRRIEEVSSDGDALDPALRRHLSGGKRTRAGLLLYVQTCLIQTAVPTPQALDLACAVEFAHAASLILDDILDGDAVRRGFPSLHLARGEERAILDAVGVLAFPYALAAPYGAGYVAMLASTQQAMVRSVARELSGVPHLPAAELYDAVVAGKTGRLFSLAAAWGAMAAGEGEAVVGAFADYGLSAGKAMQIADDITDLHALAGGLRDCRSGSEALLLRCVPGNPDGPGGDGVWDMLESLLDREIRDAGARIADAGRHRVLPEAREAFGQAVRDIVGLTIAREVPDGGGPFRAACPGSLPQR